MITVQGYHHVRLTVTDIARSRKFYEEVFAFPVAYDLPADADDATKAALSFLFGGVIYHVGGGLFGLRPAAPEADRFDENRVGLDHFSFGVAGKAEIDAAAARLDSIGVAHGGVKDIGGAFILEFRDPDNISLELFAPGS